MTTTAARHYRWRAPLDDGIAHVYHGERRPALCGAQNLPERWDRRPERWCPECEIRLEEVEKKRKAS